VFGELLEQASVQSVSCPGCFGVCALIPEYFGHS
jgi:hypothetical protein